VGAVLLGLHLREKLPEEALENDGKIPVESGESGTEKEPSDGILPGVQGVLVDLSAYDTVSELTAAAAKLRGEGAETVSVCLRGADGTLYYPSAVAQAFALQEKDVSYLNLARAVEVLREAGFRVIGYLDLTGFSANQNAYVQQARLACDAALVNEAAAAGFDELVLCGGTEALTWASELSAVAQAFRAQQEKDAERGVVGVATRLSLAITPGTLFSDEAPVRAAEWLRSYDALALDLRNYGGRVGEQVDMWTYWLLRYEMRLLLPAGEGSDAEEQGWTSWLEAAG
jgi:hypothetical protein